MKNATRTIAIVCLLIVGQGLGLSPARADQSDPRLDMLFEQLQAADAETAVAIDAEIWRIWSRSGDQRLDAIMREGVIAMQQRNWEKAEAAFTTLVVEAPYFAEAWNKRATLYYLMGRLEDSIRDCAKVLSLEPRHYGTLSGLGLIHAALGDAAKAVEWLERALEVNPHMADVKTNLESIREQMKGRRI